jgi:Domain of unknown function (DUF4124)
LQQEFLAGVLPMNVIRVLFPIILGLAVSSTVSSQVYESKDDQGNTVFSDRPTEGAEVVKVPATNSADPVAEIPRPAQSAATPDASRRNTASPAGATQRQADEDDEYIYYGGGAFNNDAAEQRREELQDRREEGADKPGREPPQVEPHRNVPRPAAGGGGRR